MFNVCSFWIWYMWLDSQFGTGVCLPLCDIKAFCNHPEREDSICWMQKWNSVYDMICSKVFLVIFSSLPHIYSGMPGLDCRKVILAPTLLLHNCTVRCAQCDLALSLWNQQVCPWRKLHLVTSIFYFKSCMDFSALVVLSQMYELLTSTQILGLELDYGHNLDGLLSLACCNTANFPISGQMKKFLIPFFPLYHSISDVTEKLMLILIFADIWLCMVKS